MGEKVGAVVVFKPGAETRAEAIREFLEGRIADFKIPQYFVFRPEPLARNPGGKILKSKLRREVNWGKPVA